MRIFFSPAEKRLLEALPEEEAVVAEAIMRFCDAHLIEEEPPAAEQPSLFDVA